MYGRKGTAEKVACCGGGVQMWHFFPILQVLKRYRVQLESVGPGVAIVALTWQRPELSGGE